MSTKYLLKGGTIATSVQGSDEPRVFKADVLVDGNTITRIEGDIAPGPGVEVIDCQDKWITPGFIDTHRYAHLSLLYYAYVLIFAHASHVFMTVLRGTQCEWVSKRLYNAVFQD